MKKAISILALSVMLWGCEAYGMLSTRDIVSKSETGVVSIIGIVKNDAGTVVNGGQGTGFFVGENYIITNHHVVNFATEIFIQGAITKKRYDVRIVGTDPVSDIAILELKDWEMFEVNEQPAILTLGNSDLSLVGDKVVVIGHPWGLEWSVSEGIVSAKNRRPHALPKFLDQIDAKLFNGNSGGPIFNDEGDVVCVAELMIPGEGGSYGMCVPSNLVKKVVHDITTHNQVRWRSVNAGISLTEDGSYVKIASLEKDGAGAKAGLQVGDLIVELYTPDHPDGIKIHNPDTLLTEMAVLKSHETKVQMLIKRGSEEMMINIETTYRTSDYFESVTKLLK
jgi:serine protease Do